MSNTSMVIASMIQSLRFASEIDGQEMTREWVSERVAEAVTQDHPGPVLGAILLAQNVFGDAGALMIVCDGFELAAANNTLTPEQQAQIADNILIMRQVRDEPAV